MCSRRTREILDIVIFNEGATLIVYFLADIFLIHNYRSFSHAITPYFICLLAYGHHIEIRLLGSVSLIVDLIF